MVRRSLALSIIPRRGSSILALVSAFCITLWYLSLWTEDVAPPSLSNAPQPGTELFDDGRIRWRKEKQRYPVKSIVPLPTGAPKILPKLQHDHWEESTVERTIREERQESVKKVFLRSWKSYVDSAWLSDELAPLTGGGITSFGGWAATLVDSLDTLYIMGLQDEFEHAVQAATQIDFTVTDSEVLNVFETTIRYLGGLLGAFDISNGKYPELLEKAALLGEILYTAFDTKNHMPVTRWPWRDGHKDRHAALETCIIAEVGSLTLEFTRLSQLTGDPRFHSAVQTVTDAFDKAQIKTKIPGLFPVMMNARVFTFQDTAFTIGGMADSFYEYLPKEYVLLGGLQSQYQRMYESSLQAMKKHLFFRPMTPNDDDVLIAGSAEWDGRGHKSKRNPEGQHLSCFAGAMVAIGSRLFDQPADLTIARKLVDGCIWAYNNTVTGIMPEIFYAVPCGNPDDCHWDKAIWKEHIRSKQQRVIKKLPEMPYEDQVDYLIEQQHLFEGFTGYGDTRYILRPEAVESIFVLYRMTGDKSLQEAAWRMFQAIEKYTSTDLANAAINDVTVESPEKSNRMESFWLAETLKYFYLIFSKPDLMSLDDFVL
ncbi:hypothetical protein MMC25_005358 [Agyrium rufum]|nr:hypothetical protein [Agyrium rufum]